MKYSENCVELVKRFEGLYLKRYTDSAGVLTIGYGHTGINLPKQITEKEAEDYLKADLTVSQKKVNKYNKKYSFNQNQFDALVSFAFNIGNIDTLTGNGTRDLDTIASKILEYNKCTINGVKTELVGLTRRRLAEQNLFCQEVTVNKTNDEIATEVINGLWGNGDERKDKLSSAGYDYETIQQIVNSRLSSTTKLSIEEVAKKVINGDYGNGKTRKTKLESDGYNYDEVQKKVNELLK